MFSGETIPSVPAAVGAIDAAKAAAFSAAV